MKREALLTADSRLHEIQTLQRAREEIVRLRIELKAIKSRTNLTDERKICFVMKGEISIFETGQIIRCEASSNYTRIFPVSGKCIMVSTTLKKVAPPLTAAGFLRIHHSHLVNPKYIRKVIKGKDHCLQLCDGSFIPVSRSCRKMLSLWLDTIPFGAGNTGSQNDLIAYDPLKNNNIFNI